MTPKKKKPADGIYVKNLTRKYGTITAIREVSFAVKSGEVVGFLGPNGAGKSTTMRILSGIISASTGSAWIGGICVAQNPHMVKSKIGYMPENNPLPEDMRVVEYLRFRARLKNIPRSRLRDSVQEAMETCDLARTARRKIIGTLSKGFRQRVGIADALLGKPEIILMDEPTIGLDPHQIQGIRELINNLKGKHTVIISSHILPEIERSCDRVIILNRGRIVATGSSEELREEFFPGKRFSLVVEGTEVSVSDRLTHLGFEAEILEKTDMPGNRLHLILRVKNETVEGTKLIDALSRQQIFTLHSLAPYEPNLEEIFLTATKRSWEETIKHKPKVTI